jgi:hypothetical protein
MSDIRYQSAGNVRKRAHNVNNVLWTDDELNELIDRWSISAHVSAGRALTSPWVEGTDDVYEVVRTYVLNASACEILSGLEIDDQGKCEKAAEAALALLTGGSGQTAVVTDHFDLIDGLDEDHYGQQFT